MPGLIATAALAVNVACASIGSADARAECRAIERREVAHCMTIADADRREACRAEVKKDPSICYSIIDPAIRDICRVRAGRM